MRIYEVGGAVRDALLGRPVRERDWLVVGATADELLALGYRRVGKDFPVFLHPQTGEEYALARTERKIAPGYTGFTFETTPDITLEQDLERRDLTINAMARDADGRLVDPCGGRRDLEDRKLRHVSEAFREDPVRILRTARFAAQFAELGFTVAAETQRLMRDMVDNGEVDALRPERVWKETEKALAMPRPDVFVETLRGCGALARIYPEIDALFGIPQPERWHPEIDTGVHVLMALRLAARLTDAPTVRFAVLTHDLGKGTTPPEILPRHRGHEERSVQLLEALCERMPVPRAFHDLAAHVARHHGLVHRADELRPSTVLKLLETVDAFRKPRRFEEFLLACEADARGRKGLEEAPYPQANRLLAALAAAAAVDARALAEQTGLGGRDLGDALRERRIDAIRGAVASAPRTGASPRSGATGA
ncbi:MAG: multifunctional CCA addition/repair protein [Gammaproteobacteria bacterium]|nr:multifunctional CCA addition/repair protein [Gammaproteobacteria bacterium]